MKNLAPLLLWFAVIWAAVWFGGQLFNALMVVPYFSHNLPESLTAWSRMRFDNLADFFVIFSPLWSFLALLIAFFFAKGARARGSIITGAGLALLCMVLLVWMVPMIFQLTKPDHGGLDAAAIVRQLHRWTVLNWVRLAVDFSIFAAAIRSLVLFKAERPHS